MGPVVDMDSVTISVREAEVLNALGEHLTNAQIAQKLYISVRTVETHRSRIQQKLSVSTRAELVRYALDHKLVEDR